MTQSTELLSGILKGTATRNVMVLSTFDRELTGSRFFGAVCMFDAILVDASMFALQRLAGTALFRP